MGNEEWLAPNDVIPVNDDDIAEAIRQNQFNCAIVCGIERKYPDARHIRVNREHIRWSVGENRYEYPTPEYAVETIIQPLDTGGQPIPGLVRLTGGKITEVKHKTNAHIQNQRHRRRNDMRGRDNDQHRSDYGRFK